MRSKPITPSDCDRQSVPPLLHFIDARVCGDVGASGLQGRLALGLTAGQGRVWWNVVFFADRLETSFSFETPLRAHAYALLDETGQSEKRITIRGNRALLERFLARYLEPQNWLALRLRR